MGSPLTFGALADDFTGAVELAAMLRAAGARAMVHVGPGSLPDRPPEVDAIVVALRTRAAPAGEAVAISRQVAQQLRRLGARQLFLKYCATFDSLPAGNIGNVAEVLREVAGAAPVLFCPTYPEAARTVFRGHMFVGGQLLADSPKRHDPLTPMTNSNLAEVLALQTSLAVDILPYEVVAAGAAAIHTHAEACHAAGRPFLIADSILPEDLRQIAAASCDWPVMTGGASVAAYFPSLWVARGWMRPSEQPSLPGTPFSPEAAPTVPASRSRHSRGITRCSISTRSIRPNRASRAPCPGPASIWPMPPSASPPPPIRRGLPRPRRRSARSPPGGAPKRCWRGSPPAWWSAGSAACWWPGARPPAPSSSSSGSGRFRWPRLPPSASAAATPITPFRSPSA